MQVTLENKRRATIEFPKSAFKRKNKAEEGGCSRSRVKKEQERTEA
jgi:hypothetical protein